MEDADPDVRLHTGYMKKMHKHIVKVIEALENCGYEKLLSLAHGDAKPNNFMFRFYNGVPAPVEYTSWERFC